MTSSKDCLSPLAFEHVLAGFTDARVRRWREHLRVCAACAERLDQAERQGQVYASSPEAAALRQRLPAEAPEPSTPRPFRRRALLWATPVFAAVAILLMAWPSLRHPMHPRLGFEIKGGRLGLFVQRQGEPIAWQGQVLREGDLVQPTWVTPVSEQIALFGRKADGEVVLLYPDSGDSSVAVAAGGPTSLGASLVMTRDLDGLRVFALHATRPFPLSPARAALARFQQARALDKRLAQVKVVEIELGLSDGKP